MPDMRDIGGEALREAVNGRKAPRPVTVYVSYDELDTKEEVVERIRAQIGPGGTADRIDFDSTVVDGRKLVRRIAVTYRPREK